MKLSQDTLTAKITIQSFAEGIVTINNKPYLHNLLITPELIIPDWDVTDFTALCYHHFEVIAQLQPELVLLGVGMLMRFPSPAVLSPLINQKIGIETMTTPAACRTFNLLAGEGRNVVAALLLR